jgi:hypothetical protein
MYSDKIRTQGKQDNYMKRKKDQPWPLFPIKRVTIPNTLKNLLKSYLVGHSPFKIDFYTPVP